MKIYDVEIPDDLQFPDLDEKTKAEADALHAESLHHEVEIARSKEEDRVRGRKILTEDEAWQLANPGVYGPRPPPTVNIEALRKLTPHLRAIFAYIHRDDITY